MTDSIDLVEEVVQMVWGLNLTRCSFLVDLEDLEDCQDQGDC